MDIEHVNSYDKSNSLWYKWLVALAWHQMYIELAEWGYIRCPNSYKWLLGHLPFCHDKVLNWKRRQKCRFKRLHFVQGRIFWQISVWAPLPIRHSGVILVRGSVFPQNLNLHGFGSRTLLSVIKRDLLPSEIKYIFLRHATLHANKQQTTQLNSFPYPL